MDDDVIEPSRSINKREENRQPSVVVQKRDAPDVWYSDVIAGNGRSSAEPHKRVRK